MDPCNGFIYSLFFNLKKQDFYNSTQLIRTMICKLIFNLSLAGVFCFCSVSLNAAKENYTFNDKGEVRENVSNGLHDMLEVKVTKNVKKYIGSYLIRGKAGTQKIIGNATIYFPVFEEYLEAFNLPQELKYLSVIESGLNPNATSPSGAVGLWQFMKPTARELGLVIDDYVDERKDIYRSTEAAVKYLKQLHDRYQDWGLAIAAYNCGFGRVDRELEKTGGKDFWSIRSRLPKETQHYIDRFIAVNYAIKNYQFYNLRPQYPDYTLQMTQVQKIHKRFSFKKIAELTGIKEKTIARLNPSYRKGIIPPNHNGYYLVLPAIGVQEGWEG